MERWLLSVEAVEIGQPAADARVLGPLGQVPVDRSIVVPLPLLGYLDADPTLAYSTTYEQVRADLKTISASA